MPQAAANICYTVQRGEVLRYLGYAGQPVDESLDARIDGMIDRCLRVSTPVWTYRVFPVREEADGVRLEGTTLLLTGHDIRAHLAGARECAVMAATAGLANERELRRLSLLNGLDGMLFDAAGSALAEAVADACNNAIVEDAAARGLHAKWRYSPGYGDLPLNLQPQVVRVLDADKRLGLSATPEHLLIPAKSVTAFVGLFATPQDRARTCATCPMAATCPLRRTGRGAGNNERNEACCR